jgi:hypothetical protein
MLARKSERISTKPFLPHLSPGDKIENCSAQFLAVCWIVHVEFKVHRLRDGFGVGNALLLSQSLPTFISHFTRHNLPWNTERAFGADFHGPRWSPVDYFF